MDITNIICAFIALIGSLGGTFGGILVSNKLTVYRIEQLEKKIESFKTEHNDYEKRIYALEADKKVYAEKFQELERQLADLKSKLRS